MSETDPAPLTTSRYVKSRAMSGSVPLRYAPRPPVETDTRTDVDPPAIKACQEVKLGYMAAIDDAAAHMRRREAQDYCPVCARWKWPSELCEHGRKAIYG